jgi:hypothetical protein
MDQDQLQSGMARLGTMTAQWRHCCWYWDVPWQVLVVYPKKAFDEAGYTVPTHWDEMMQLTAEIASDGDTPWCIGIE